MVVIIEFGPPVRVYETGQLRRSGRYPGGFVAGLDDQFTLVEHEGVQRGLQLNLTPIGGRLFFDCADVRAHAAGGAHWPICSVATIVDLAERLESLPDWDARFDVVEDLVAARDRTRRAPRPRRDGLGDGVRSSAPAARSTSRALCRELGYSQKHVIACFAITSVSRPSCSRASSASIA